MSMRQGAIAVFPFLTFFSLQVIHSTALRLAAQPQVTDVTRDLVTIT